MKPLIYYNGSGGNNLLRKWPHLSNKMTPAVKHMSTVAMYVSTVTPSLLWEQRKKLGVINAEFV